MIEKYSLVCQMIDVEAGIDVICSSHYIVPYVATAFVGRWSCRKFSLGWKSQALLHERGIAAGISTLVDRGHKRIIEANDTVVLVQSSNGRCFNDHIILIDGRINDLDPLEVIVCFVFPLQHIVGNVGLFPVSEVLLDSYHNSQCIVPHMIRQ